MSKKIIVVGANQTGLAFAYLASKRGFEVTVYEAKEKSEVAYDWTDDMEESAFEDAGLPFPPENLYTRKRCWTFIAPKKEKNVFVEIPADKLDLSIYRRPFNDWLLTLAENAGAVVRYSTKVRRAVAKDDRIIGVELESGDFVSAGLVTDCGGVNSAVRRSLPESMKIQKNVAPSDTFFVRRAFFDRPDGTARPEFTNKAYLKHLGEAGISWCILSHDEKQADVLIGRVGNMSDAVYGNALDDIRRDNAIVGRELMKGGQLLQIPVRRPLPRFVASGYAAVGDSACMTIPMLGSGMASGMKAAKILADTLSDSNCDVFGIANLYRYQAEFMKQTGGKHAAVDMMKNWLLNSRDGEVDFLLNKGVVSKKILIDASAGRMVEMSVPEMAVAAVKGFAKLPLLLQLAGLLAKMKKECRVASNMPKTFDEKAFDDWSAAYEKPFKK